MRNKIVATLVAAVVAVSVMGCGVTTTTTYTETTTDADGNTTTTTTTTKDGETTTETTTETAEEVAEEATEEATEEVESTVATIAFDNQTDFDFAELYFSSAASDNWGDNILGSDAPLAVGETITYNDCFTYSADNTVWDIQIVDTEGNSVDFTGADMLAASDPEDIYILFTYDADTQSYSASIQ